MTKFDIQRIKRLPPEKRIEALKELEEKLGEFVKEKNKEILESKKEIEEAENMLEEAEEETQVLLKIQTPKAKILTVDEVWDKKEEEKKASLEGIAGEAEEKRTDKIEREEYVNILKQKPVGDFYERIKSVYSDIKQTGIITADQQEMLQTFRTALYEKENDAVRGEYEADRNRIKNIKKLERGISSILEERMYSRGSD